MSAHIVFTGGGTAGHVTPNLALIEELKKEGWKIDYIGSADGIELSMIKPLNLPFHAISSGKLRRYFSFKTLLEPFKISWGIIQSFMLMRQLKPDVVFSKGGFVAFPVVVGAWLNRIPVVAHESDISPGLANRLCFPFVSKICLTFAAGKSYFKNQEKIEVTGTPIRPELFQGQKAKGLELCSFTADKPCILVIGGSLGAGSINQAIRSLLPKLLGQYQVIHICGKGKKDESLNGLQGYCQWEYVTEELTHLFAAADLLVSRSGANSLYEILALGKAHILIPLSKKASRGDQIQNAAYFQQQGVSAVLDDDRFTPEDLLAEINKVMAQRDELTAKIKALNINSATPRVIEIIKEQAHVSR